jgi:SulP family sulfate permease
LLTFLSVRQLQRLERKLERRLPAALLAIGMVTLIVWGFGLDGLDVSHRVQVVRDIEPLRRQLPQLRLPLIDVGTLRALLGPACAIALMGAIEAIAVGKTLAVRAGHAFDASRQLVGEGCCNLGAALIGGFASSGSFTRTAVNFEAGAVTRLSCVLSGLLTLLLVLAFAPAANLIPVAALAGTLVHIGIKLIDVARLRAVFATTIGDRLVMLVTFSAVLFAEHLENALMLGVAASVYNALRRAEGFKLNVLTAGDDGSLREPSGRDPSASDQVTVLNLQGELFFAAAEELQGELTRLLGANARFIVLRVHEAYNMDATTAAAIAQVADKARRRGGRLLLCGVRPGMYGTFERAGLLTRIGEDAVFPAEAEVLASTRHAVSYAHALAAASNSGS